MLIVRKLRLRRGWSQAELAQFSGLSVRTIQRIEKGEKPGLETLKSLAAVFDMEASDFHIKEEDMKEPGITVDEKKAFEYVKDLKGFYIGLIVYVLVIGGLFAINLLTAPEYIWAKWPALGWGIGVVLHGARVFSSLRLFGPDWEKRQIEKHLGRDL